LAAFLVFANKVMSTDMSTLAGEGARRTFNSYN